MVETVLVFVLVLAAGLATGWIVPAASVAGLAEWEHRLQYCFCERFGHSTGCEPCWLDRGLCLGLAAGSSVGGAEATAAILVLLEAVGGPRVVEAKSAILALLEAV